MLSIPADELARELARDALTAVRRDDIEHMGSEHPLGLADQPARQIPQEKADQAVVVIRRDGAMKGRVLSERMREHEDKPIECLRTKPRILRIRLGEEVRIERAHPREVGHLERADHASATAAMLPGLVAFVENVPVPFTCAVSL